MTNQDGRNQDTSAVLRALISISRRGVVGVSSEEAPLSVTDQSIVMVIAENPGVRSIDLAQRFGLNRSTLSRQVAGLIKLGLVQEVPSSSRRGRPLELTPAGVAAFESTLGTLHRAINAQLADWSDEEVARFVHDLERFNRGRDDREKR